MGIINIADVEEEFEIVMIQVSLLMLTIEN